tara:strand:- start:1873 stop:2283 length:411 start_codon:yes stop_codon:yes gene_type:complete
MSLTAHYNTLPVDLQNIINEDLDNHIYMNLQKPVQDCLINELVREKHLDFLENVVIGNIGDFPCMISTREAISNLRTSPKNHIDKTRSDDKYLSRLYNKFSQIERMIGMTLEFTFEVLDSLQSEDFIHDDFSDDDF